MSKELPQEICSICVRRLSDCFELKFQIEQSEQFLLGAVANQLFMGLSNDFSVDSDQHLVKSNSIIDTIQSVVTDFEATYAGSTATEDVPEVIGDIETNDVIPEKSSTSKSTFNCQICPKKFSTSSKLDRHLTKQHLVRNDVNVYKPHQCDQCPKSYTTKANLVLHKAVHSGKTIELTFPFQ